VNLDSLPIEVTGCIINDQELFSSSSVCVCVHTHTHTHTHTLLCPGHLWGLSSW